MDEIYDFLANNVLIFLCISIFLFFALLGFAFEGKIKARKERRSKKGKEEVKEENQAPTTGALETEIHKSEIETGDLNMSVEQPTEIVAAPTLEEFNSNAQNSNDPNAIGDMFGVESVEENSEGQMLVIDDPSTKLQETSPAIEENNAQMPVNNLMENTINSQIMQDNQQTPATPMVQQNQMIPEMTPQEAPSAPQQNNAINSDENKSIFE